MIHKNLEDILTPLTIVAILQVVMLLIILWDMKGYTYSCRKRSLLKRFKKFREKHIIKRK